MPLIVPPNQKVDLVLKQLPFWYIYIHLWRTCTWVSPWMQPQDDTPVFFWAIFIRHHFWMSWGVHRKGQPGFPKMLLLASEETGFMFVWNSYTQLSTLNAGFQFLPVTGVTKNINMALWHAELCTNPVPGSCPHLSWVLSPLEGPHNAHSHWGWRGFVLIRTIQDLSAGCA